MSTHSNPSNTTPNGTTPRLMTHNTVSNHAMNTQQADTREQLSALMDGELDGDATRFLLKRCDADAELVQCWQRWHVTGEVMRGGQVTPFRIDLVQAVSMALDAEDKPAAGFGRTALRWGGGFAIAASVALAALIVVQPGEAPESTLAANVPTVLPVSTSVATVAASSLREQDLRPPLRIDAQTVSDEGMPYRTMRFDPRIEAYLLQQAQAQRMRAQLQPAVEAQPQRQ